MSINIGPPVVDELKPKIAVIGVGGAGGNAIANMIAANVEGVDFIVANTDAQALNSSSAEHRIQLGPEITEGLGAGSRPEVGRAAAEETIDQVEEALEGAHMCFIAAGMGGGTGTGAAPVIAAAARARNILTVGVVTKPFMFEGTRRMRAAESGIDELQKNVDTLIVIPNQNLFLVASPNTTFKEAFLLADEVLQQGVRSITDLMVMPGLINLDFADVRSVMQEMGKAMMGTGESEGDNRALEAAEKAINNPLLDGVSMQGAKGVIVSIVGGEDMGLLEVDAAANHIRELVDPDANIIWGSAFNNDLDGRIRVSVVATGIDGDGAAAAETARPFSLSQASLKPKAAPVQAASDDVWVEEEPSSVSPAPPVAEDDGLEAIEDAEYEPASADDSDGAADTGSRPSFSTPVFDDLDDETGDDDDVSPSPTFGKTAAKGSDPSGGSTSARFGAPPPQAPGIEPDEDEEEDTLELGSDMVDEPREQPKSDAAPTRRRNFGRTDDTDADRAAPRVSQGGGTLFERMTNLSRGSASNDREEEDEGEAINIPRFLNRQNNK